MKISRYAIQGQPPIVGSNAYCLSTVESRQRLAEIVGQPAVARMRRLAEKPYPCCFLHLNGKFYLQINTTSFPKTLGQTVIPVGGRILVTGARHTFISHALAGGRTLAEIRDSAGHANVSITSAYLHVVVDDDAVGNLFGFAT